MSRLSAGCWSSPVVLGSGKRLFDTGAATSAFTLVHHDVTSTGVVHQILCPTAFTAGEVGVKDGKATV
jgi:hypothetical protein